MRRLYLRQRGNGDMDAVDARDRKGAGHLFGSRRLAPRCMPLDGGSRSGYNGRTNERSASGQGVPIWLRARRVMSVPTAAVRSRNGWAAAPIAASGTHWWRRSCRRLPQGGRRPRLSQGEARAHNRCQTSLLTATSASPCPSGSSAGCWAAASCRGRWCSSVAIRASERARCCSSCVMRWQGPVPGSREKVPCCTSRAKSLPHRSSCARRGWASFHATSTCWPKHTWRRSPTISNSFSRGWSWSTPCRASTPR